MADICKDTWLNQWLKGLRLADHVYSDASVRWGEFIEPNKDPRPVPTGDDTKARGDCQPADRLPGAEDATCLCPSLSGGSSHCLCLLTDDRGQSGCQNQCPETYLASFTRKMSAV